MRPPPSVLPVPLPPKSAIDERPKTGPANVAERADKGGRNGKGPAILCDFDGTVTVCEVSTSLLDEFSGHRWRDADGDLLAGRMTLRETMEREFGLLRAPRRRMEAFVGRIHLRPGFAELVAEASARSAPLLIVSEGLDFYIAAILRHRGLSVEYRTNHAVFSVRRTGGRPGGIVVEHPYSSKGCDRCGTCKKAQLEQFRDMGCETVYIGDGISDRCPARHADVLFARNGLLDFCRSEGIRCLPYDDFHDVLGALRARYWK